MHTIRTPLLALAVLAGVHAFAQPFLLQERFEGSFPPAGWTITGGSDGWTYGPRSGLLSSICVPQGDRTMVSQWASFYPNNTWAFTPGLTLAAGTTYGLSFKQCVASPSSNKTESLKVTVGTQASSSAQTNVLLDLPSLTNTTTATHSTIFKPLTSGVYYFAFQCYSAANQRYLSVDDVGIYIIYDCPAAQANIGDACDDGDASTGNDVYDTNCSCVGRPLDCQGVPGGTATVGTACDDGDADTGNDVYGADCVCAGQLLDCLGTPGGPALPGTSCDDGDANTGNDIYGEDCVCAGQSLDCLGVPGGTATIGSPCDDGDANTGDDVYGTDCICAGQLIDCLGVAGGTALPGTSCDDGDPLTTDDVYGNDCVCAGTPPCTGNQVVVTIHTDANGGQTTWQIQDAFAFTLASGGPYTGQDNTTVSETACLPTTFGNCYSFFLFDSFGDGLCCANGNGYWELNTPGGATLLRDRFEASTNGSQSPSTTPLSAGYLLGHEFCLPEGPSNILPEGCGVFSNTLQSKVYTRAIPGVASYQFEFSDPDAGFRRRIAVPRNWVKFSEMQTSPLVPGVTYFARARADQGASGFEDDHFGTGCEMGVDPASIGCTSLIDDPVQPTHSCGAVKHFGGSDKIWARPLLGATQYRFRFTNAGEGFVRQIDRPSYVCLLSWVTTPLQPGVTYDVTVNALVSGAWTGFCGSTCQLTIIANGGRPETRMAEVPAGTLAAHLWPNPGTGERVNVQAQGFDPSVSTVAIDVLDLSGKVVRTRTLPVMNGQVNTVLDLGALDSGTYLMRFSTHDQVLVERFVVQR